MQKFGKVLAATGYVSDYAQVDVRQGDPSNSDISSDFRSAAHSSRHSLRVVHMYPKSCTRIAGWRITVCQMRDWA